jgi:hypothetical protein
MLGAVYVLIDEIGCLEIGGGLEVSCAVVPQANRGMGRILLHQPYWHTLQMEKKIFECIPIF